VRKRCFFTYETGMGIIGGLMIAFVVVAVIRIFSPILCSLAEEKLQSRFNKICNTAVMEYLEENLDLSDIAVIERTPDGDVQGITTDTVKVNKFKSWVSLEIQKELDKLDEITVEVPSGGFFGFGSGVRIPVKLMSQAVLETDVVSSFESVGINQTRLCVDASISLSGKLLAIGKGNMVKIETKVPMLMTVIVGEVPGTYVDVKK